MKSCVPTLRARELQVKPECSVAAHPPDECVNSDAAKGQRGRRKMGTPV